MSDGTRRSVAAWGRQWWSGWNDFWFRPAEPETLALIRVCAGFMLFYTHLIWGLELQAFLGADAWITTDVVREAHQFNAPPGETSYVWSYLFYLESPGLLWATHLAGLAVFALLTVGCFTRLAAVLAWIICLSYCHRLVGSLFGLDQINALLAMYLMIGPSGDAYSIDAWRRRREGRPPPRPTVGANVAIRLIQLHLCVIYLFSGVGKMRGATWWNGTAVWYSLSNLEYQSLDVTWTVHSFLVINLLTHFTVFWETFYIALIWPRLTRPLMLAGAVLVHGGIAAFMGMPTFGVVMLIANMAFLEPQWVRGVVGAAGRLVRGGGAAEQQA